MQLNIIDHLRPFAAIFFRSSKMLNKCWKTKLLSSWCLDTSGTSSPPPFDAQSEIFLTTGVKFAASAVLIDDACATTPIAFVYTEKQENSDGVLSVSGCSQTRETQIQIDTSHSTEGDRPEITCIPQTQMPTQAVSNATK